MSATQRPLDPKTPLRALLVRLWKEYTKPRRRILALIAVYYQLRKKLRVLRQRSRRNGSSSMIYLEHFGLFRSVKEILLLLVQRADLHEAAFFTYLRDVEYMIDMRLRALRTCRCRHMAPNS